MRFKSGKVKFVAVDEPSSALDAEGELDLFRNLLAVREEKTMVFVTHRFGHLTKHANLILCVHCLRLPWGSYSRKIWTGVWKRDPLLNRAHMRISWNYGENTQICTTFKPVPSRTHNWVTQSLCNGVLSCFWHLVLTWIRPPFILYSFMRRWIVHVNAHVLSSCNCDSGLDINPSSYTFGRCIIAHDHVHVLPSCSAQLVQ